ncbi:hypothetical protein R1flu_024687 [Riccia fluitans]|uniref:KHG/KDPG aldolase n=1 Tax=Riccia fluitans TaxID=41844 RepID=A0ABD1XVL2_9MARC
MGAESVLQQISGTPAASSMQLATAGAAATSLSSVGKRVATGTAAASAVFVHGRCQAAVEFLSWKNERQSGAPCTLRAHNSWLAHVNKNKKRRALPLLCSASAGSSFSFEDVVRDQKAAGASGPNSAIMESTVLGLRKAGIIACLRTTCADLALGAARAALDGGLTVMEVTMTTPSAAKVIQSLVREYPSAIIGAGTVLSWREAEIAKQAGANFLTSPVTVEEMVRAHSDGPVLFLPGAMTPTEVVSAYNMGAPAVKLFPTALLGDIRFVLALRKTLGHIPLIPSNGISLDMVESYLSAGVMAVILSDAIFEKSAVECRDFSRITTLATSAASKNLCRDNSLT